MKPLKSLYWILLLTSCVVAVTVPTTLFSQAIHDDCAGEISIVPGVQSVATTPAPPQPARPLPGLFFEFASRANFRGLAVEFTGRDFQDVAAGGVAVLSDE